VTEYLTGWAETYALSTITSEACAECLVQYILRHGAPQRILSDRGRQFISQLWNAVLDIFKTKRINSTPYHPQTNGLTERFNGTLCELLSMYAEPTKHYGVFYEQWDELLPAVTSAYNSTLSASRKFTPHYLMYGREIRLPIDVASGANSSVLASPLTQHVWATQLAGQLRRAHTLVRVQIDRARAKQKARYDHKHRSVHFEVGDKVAYKKPPANVEVVNKLTHAWKGPFTITYASRDGNWYKLVDSDGALIQGVSVAFLKPYFDQAARPPLDQALERVLSSSSSPSSSLASPSSPLSSSSSSSSAPSETTEPPAVAVPQAGSDGQQPHGIPESLISVLEQLQFMHNGLRERGANRYNRANLKEELHLLLLDSGFFSSSRRHTAFKKELGDSLSSFQSCDSFLARLIDNFATIFDVECEEHQKATRRSSRRPNVTS
jgi:hypothetical protein